LKPLFASIVTQDFHSDSCILIARKQNAWLVERAMQEDLPVTRFS
jgi:hypothetical protein